jgi:hypothetical protein
MVPNPNPGSIDLGLGVCKVNEFLPIFIQVTVIDFYTSRYLTALTLSGYLSIPTYNTAGSVYIVLCLCTIVHE